MAYCTKCGHQNRDGARFCDTCGGVLLSESASTQGTRKQEYSGKIVKCPVCGEKADSFIPNCPACGHEFRGAELADSLKEFSKKIEHMRYDKEKANLIRTFPIPNAKEDILEFMILASTNIENSYQPEVSEAWSVKFEQAYEKSTILYGDSPEFSRCYNLFLRKKRAAQQIIKRNERKAVHAHKKEHVAKRREQCSRFFENNKNWLLRVGAVIAVFLLIASLSIPHTILEKQLERLVVDVETCINKGDFEEARIKANQIIYDSNWSSDSRYKWDRIRWSLLESIERAEIAAGKRICVGITNRELKGKSYADVVAFFSQKGYTNIRTEAILDLITGWLTGDGEVEKVTINGSTVFDEETAYEANVEIVVYYHSFKN